MNRQQFHQIEAYFHRLVDLSPEQRSGPLAALAGEDPEAHAEVLRLLEEEDASRDDASLVERVGGLLRPLTPYHEGARVGPYLLRRRLGEGGMGVVWEAEQAEPIRRTVALKLIKWGMDTEAVVRRFRAERQALALMQHPGIAGVYDAGATEDGRPYFAMECVDGTPITLFCDEHRSTLEQRVTLVARVCDAVHHAHQKGIIHRDLKPSNLLVVDGPDGPLPKVIDFGIAKATEQSLLQRTLYTAHGEVVGTPDYMSPEQAQSHGLDVDVRSDVYSLGVVLYELLVGSTPWPRPSANAGPAPGPWSYDSTITSGAEVFPPSSRLSPESDEVRQLAAKRRADAAVLKRKLRGELDWIVLKALDLDRDLRYESAAALAEDLRRFLQHQPVSAGPPSVAYRLRKAARRHRVAVTVAALVSLSIGAGSVLATVGLFRARAAERVARTAQGEAEREAETTSQIAEFLLELFRVSDPGEARGNSVTAREILDRGVERIDTELADQPLVQARLMDTMGDVYMRLGLYAEAERLLGSALERRRNSLGADHPEVASTLVKLAGLHRRRLELPTAREEYREALRIREAALGPEHSDVAQVLTNLGIVHRLLGQHDEAQRVLQRALAIEESQKGDDSRSTASILNNLAVVEVQSDDLVSARDHLERVLAILERQLGPDHPDIATVLGNLGYAARRLGENRAAREHYRRDLALSRRTLGPDHPDVALALRNLAYAERALGELRPAREHLEESLSILGSTLGEDHTSVANARASLAELEVHAGDLERAWSLNEAALATLRAGENLQQRRRLVRVLEAQARVARLRSETSAARRLCEEALAVAAGLPDSVTEAARCQLQLALLELESGRRAAAEERYAEATRGLEDGSATFLDDPVGVASRAAFLAAKGEHAEALGLLEEAIDDGLGEAWVRDNPDLGPLAGRPELDRLLADLDARLRSR